MVAITASVELKGLGKRKMRALAEKAKRLGITPERYIKQLVEDDLAMERAARTRSFAELMAPVRAEFRKSRITEEELDTLVDAARSRYHARVSSKGRKR